jgi:hypothetical protein
MFRGQTAAGEPRTTAFGGTAHVTSCRDMLSLMDQGTTALERAFELARSGDHRSIDQIKQRLRAEGYSDAQVTGGTLSRQLRALIRSARNVKAAIGAPT